MLRLALILALLLAAPARAEDLLPPIEATPDGAKGTVILLPASGWASPTEVAMQTIWSRVAPMLHRAGYRTVAIDYPAGAPDALATIAEVVRAERRRTRGPLCLYGESSGGHLAVMTGVRIREVDCTLTFGAPFSFSGLAREAAEHPERVGYRNAMEVAIEPTFGADPAGWQGWEPAEMLTPVPVPTLAMICADDQLVPPEQVHMLPGAETYMVPKGRRAYVHGTASAAGMRVMRQRVLSFLGRATGQVSARRS